MYRNLLNWLTILLVLPSCSGTSPTISVVCEENNVGNAIIKWETAPILKGQVKVYASTSPDFIPEENPVATINIEKGKNNAPPDPSDIEALIQKLGLSDKEASLFKEKASADRGRLPNEQMDYLLKHRKLIDLINYGLENNLNDKRWAEMLTAISGGK